MSYPRYCPKCRLPIVGNEYVKMGNQIRCMPCFNMQRTMRKPQPARRNYDSLLGHLDKEGKL